MKIDIFKAPPTLWFGEGEDRFGLNLKRFSDIERMAVIDAAATQELAAIQRAIDALIIGWQEVYDEAGNPLAFEKMDENQRMVRHLGTFLGAISLARQAQVMAGILEFLGIPAANVAFLVKAFEEEEKTTTRPTPPPDDDTPPNVSSA